MKHQSVWSRLATVLGVCGYAASSGVVCAQEAPNGELAEVVVTSSRIARTGFTAPTPTTMIGAEDMERLAATNVAEVLATLPSIRPSGPTTGIVGSSTPGANLADLRGLGATRTLVLVDGQRHVQTTQTGQVDLNVVPAAIIERTEVVTGGASAAWGSDAVSGVVNLVLKKELNGLRGSFQIGQSSRSDNKSTSGSIAWGTPFAGGRGQFAIATEYDKNEGIAKQFDREWARNRCAIVANPQFSSQAVTPTQPALIHACGVTMSSSTDGGLIISGPLKGTQFLAGGVPAPFRLGTLAQFNQNPTTLPGSGLMIGGDGTLISDLEQFKTPVRRYSAFTNSSFEISDQVQATLRVSYANALSNGQTVQPFYATGVAPGNALAIKYGNPYIPASVLAGLPAGVSGNTAFFLGRNNTDIGFARPTIEDKVLRAAAGLNGKFGGKWTWNAYVAYGKTTYEQNIYNNFLGVNGAGNGTDLNNHWLQATDVILNASGQAVCRNAAAVAQGCVPANVFGDGSISAAAKAYLTATQTQIQDFRQDVVAASIQGEPFDNWAGAVSVAAGAEYRKESVSSSVDAFSEANAFYLGNPKALFGSYNVREFFAETVVPLLKDQPFARNLDLNLAARSTNYSSSGQVTTWKGGLTYTPVNGLLLRATRSRDIRAPNLNDLFAPQQLRIATVTVPGRGSVIVSTITSGNPNLKAEEADTTTAGVVLQPAAVPGLSVSLDYYTIKLNGSIASPPAQSIVNGCSTGIATLCTLLRNSVDGSVAPIATFDRLLLQSVNLAETDTKGLDIELAYRLPLARLFESAKGTMNFRLLGTHVTELTTNDGLNTPLSISRNAGQTGVGGGVPTWSFTGVIGYQAGNLGLNAQVRYVGSGVYNNNINSDPAKGAVNTIDDNHMPAATYVGFSGDYNFRKSDSGKLQLYWAIDNLFDRAPPPTATASNAAYTNSTFFDVVGRTYRVGVRFSP